MKYPPPSPCSSEVWESDLTSGPCPLPPNTGDGGPRTCPRILHFYHSALCLFPLRGTVSPSTVVHTNSIPSLRGEVCPGTPLAMGGEGTTCGAPAHCPIWHGALSRMQVGHCGRVYSILQRVLGVYEPCSGLQKAHILCELGFVRPRIGLCDPNNRQRG